MESARKRRGAMNILGTGAKILFGTMDEEDRVQILSKINALENDNLNNVKFNLDYARLIDKTVANVNTTIEICNRDGKLITLLNEKLAEIIYRTELDERAIKFFHFIKDLQQIFFLMNTETSEKISELHQTLIDLHNNVFNTKLYGYRDIVESLKTVTVTEKDLEFAISLTNPDFSLLRHLIKYCLAMKDDIFYVIYTLPLVGIERLNVNKLYPIPEIIENMASYLDFDAEFLLTNRHFDKFQLWSKSQLVENCLKHEKTYYCKDLQLLRNDKESCAVKLMTENFKNLKNICKTNFLMLKEHVLIKTKNDNSYISLAPNMESGTLVTGKRVQNLKFIGSQLLTVSTNSLLSLETLQIKFYNDSNIIVERKINLTSNYDFDLKDPTWQNISVPTFEKPQIISNKLFSDTGIEINKLEDKAKKMLKPKNENGTDWIVYIVAATATLLVMAGVAIAAALMRKSNQLKDEIEMSTTEHNSGSLEPARKLQPGSSNSLPS